MQALPHRYHVKAAGRITGDVEVAAERLTALQSAPPAEFGGPGDRWSPETLLVAAVADCFILTFRALTTAARVSWISLECDVTGTLDREGRITQFTRFDMTAHLVVPAGVDRTAARHALDKAERSCLISRSLKATTAFTASVEIAEPEDLTLPA